MLFVLYGVLQYGEGRYLYCLYCATLDGKLRYDVMVLHDLPMQFTTLNEYSNGNSRGLVGCESYSDLKQKFYLRSECDSQTTKPRK